MNQEAHRQRHPKKTLRVLANIAQSVVSGILLALLFFFAREEWFPLPSVAGRWTVEMHTTETSYGPYEGMRVLYVAILWREGPIIKGTIEKISETTSKGTETYTAEERTRGEIEGFIHKYYFSQDRITVHIIEQGELRQFTHFHDLTMHPADSMTGAFIATSADSEGDVTWRRTPASTRPGDGQRG